MNNFFKGGFIYLLKNQHDKYSTPVGVELIPASFSISI